MKKDILESLSRSILKLIDNSSRENKEDQNCDGGLDIGQWPIQGRSPGGPRLPLSFITNWWGLKGWKQIFWRTLPSAPYLSSGWLGPPYLKVWIWHCRILNTIKFWKLYLWTEMWWFFINVLLLSQETEKALFYHPQPCSEKLGNEARQVTKLLQFLGAKWAPCDKGPSRALTD